MQWAAIKKPLKLKQSGANERLHLEYYFVASTKPLPMLPQWTRAVVVTIPIVTKQQYELLTQHLPSVQQVKYSLQPFRFAGGYIDKLCAKATPSFFFRVRNACNCKIICRSYCTVRISVTDIFLFMHKLNKKKYFDLLSTMIFKLFRKISLWLPREIIQLNYCFWEKLIKISE